MNGIAEGGLILGKHVVNISSPFHSSFKLLNYKPFKDWEFDLVSIQDLIWSWPPKEIMEDVHSIESMCLKKNSHCSMDFYSIFYLKVLYIYMIKNEETNKK